MLSHGSRERVVLSESFDCKQFFGHLVMVKTALSLPKSIIETCSVVQMFGSVDEICCCYCCCCCYDVTIVMTLLREYFCMVPIVFQYVTK